VIGVVGRLLVGHPDDEAVLLLRLLSVLVVAAGALLVVARAGAWRRTGAAGPATWRHVRLLAVPAVIALAPVVTGFALPATDALFVLALGYAATGLFEELWHRGVVLDVLRPLGEVPKPKDKRSPSWKGVPATAELAEPAPSDPWVVWLSLLRDKLIRDLPRTLSEAPSRGGRLRREEQADRAIGPERVPGVAGSAGADRPVDLVLGSAWPVSGRQDDRS
jgi:hypothetical protein